MLLKSKFSYFLLVFLFVSCLNSNSSINSSTDSSENDNTIIEIPEIYLETDKNSYKLGEEFNLVIKTNSAVRDVFGVNLKLFYYSDNVSILSYFDYSPFFFNNTIFYNNIDSNTVDIAVSNRNSQFSSGSNVIAGLKFKSQKIGKVYFYILNCEVYKNLEEKQYIKYDKKLTIDIQ